MLGQLMNAYFTVKGYQAYRDTKKIQKQIDAGLEQQRQIDSEIRHLEAEVQYGVIENSEEEQKFQCSSCGSVVLASYRFCGGCGMQFEQ